MRRGQLLSHLSVWAAIGLSALPVCPGEAAAPAAGDAAIASPSTVAEARDLLKQARYADAEAAARRLLAEAEARHGADSPPVFEILDLLVEALVFGGKAKDPETVALAEKTVAIREAALGPDDIALSKSLLNLAIQRGKSGRFAEARPFFERTLAIREKTLGPDHPDVAQILVSYGNLFRLTGDYLPARPLLERALAIREQALPPEHPDVAQSLNALGILLWNMGDFAGARPLLERALAIREQALGPDHPEVGSTASNLAIVIGETGDYEGARPLFERSVAIREKTLGPVHPDTAQALNNLGVLYTRTGDYARARPVFERVLAIREQVQGPDHPDLAREGLNNLGWLFTLTGQYDAARPLLERSLAMQERLLGPDHPDEAETLANLVELHIATGDDAGARPLAERALVIREKTMGPLHPYLGEIVNKVARVLANLGQTGKALEQALRAERIGRDHLRLTSRVLAERQALLYDSVRASGLDLALTLAAAGLPPDLERRAWDALVRSRALVLDEMAARHRAIGGSGDPETARLGGQLAAARTRLSNLVFRGPGPEGPEGYRGLLEESRQEKERAERALADKSSLFREEQSRHGIGLDEVHASLPPDSALVAYARYVPAGGAPVVGREAGRPAPTFAYLAFVLRSGDPDPAVVPLGRADTIDSLVRQWKEEGATEPPAVAAAARGSEDRYRRAGEALRRSLWDPVAPRLEGSRQVFVVPDGPIHLVSLGTLPTLNRRYLIETGPLLHYLSAERDLVPRRSPDAVGRGLLVLGGPDFDARPGSLPAGGVAVAQAVVPAPGTAPYRGPAAACEAFRSRRWEPLPAAGAEAEEIEALWRSKAATRDRQAGVVRLTGPLAAEAAFKQSAPGHRVVHLATHGFFVQDRCRSLLQREAPASAENPLLLSGLVLAGANRRQEAAEGEDGILTAEEIASLDLSAVEWAVLSACETGVGEIQAGEGVLGLRRAFQVAGASTLIMTLWKVKDEPAREWMRELYRGRLRGLTSAEAVRRAGLKMITARRRAGMDAHPFWWGAFVAAGDWR